jgi:hypothetical protein
MAAEAVDESDADSLRAPSVGDAHAKAGPGLFHMPAVFKQIPELSIQVHQFNDKGINLPTVTLPSLDTSGALAHSFSF